MSSEAKLFAAECHRVQVRKMIGLETELVIADRFRVLSRLGRGGHGEVLLCEDLQLGRRVALKLTRYGLSEAKSIARLRSHPNVLQVYDVGEYRGQAWLAMEWIEGETLAAWLERRPSLTARIETLRQLAEGIASVHTGGIVHRDIKPANVIVTSDGRAVLADFGLARTHSDSIREPGPVGTKGYWAPEVERGLPADERADQYSFCQVLRAAGLGPLSVWGQCENPNRRWRNMRALAAWLWACRLAVSMLPCVAILLVLALVAMPTPSQRLTGPVAELEQVGRALVLAKNGRSGEAFDAWTKLKLRDRNTLAGFAARRLVVEIRLSTRADHHIAAWIAADGAAAFARAGDWREAVELRELAAQVLDRIGEREAAERERACARQHHMQWSRC